jgi:hypothetical protein
VRKEERERGRYERLRGDVAAGVMHVRASVCGWIRRHVSARRPRGEFISKRLHPKESGSEGEHPQLCADAVVGESRAGMGTEAW